LAREGFLRPLQYVELQFTVTKPLHAPRYAEEEDTCMSYDNSQSQSLSTLPGMHLSYDTHVSSSSVTTPLHAPRYALYLIYTSLFYRYDMKNIIVYCMHTHTDTHTYILYNIYVEYVKYATHTDRLGGDGTTLVI
jgi:hypothetical protein